MMYSTGTVTVVNGSNVVTGLGTIWLTKAVISNLFKITSEWKLYTIASIDSDTQVTLSEVYTGTGGSGLSYQIVKDFTPNLNLMELAPSDRDWAIHLTINTIRKIDTLFGTTSTPQYGGLVLGTSSSHNDSVIFSQLVPVVNTWYSTGIILSVNEGFSAMLNILYEDDADHSNDRTCLCHIGGFNGGTCTPVYLSNPNDSVDSDLDTDIQVRVSINELQVRQVINTSANSKISAYIEYQTHKTV